MNGFHFDTIVETVARGRRTRRSLARSFGGVAMALSESAELGRDLVGADAGGIEHLSTFGQLGRGGSGRGGGGTTFVVQAHSTDPAVRNQQ